MKEKYKAYIAEALKDVPNGTILIKQHSSLRNFSASFMEEFAAKTEGKGKIECFFIYPGIEVSFHQYLAEKVKFNHEPIKTVLEINHCKKGRIGWNMRKGSSVYLGFGDLCLHSAESCAESEMILPLGYYEGITVTVDLNILKTNYPDILREAGFDADKIYDKFCMDIKPLGIPASDDTDAIFSPLYKIQKKLLIPYLKLKTQEILLYLQEIKTDSGKNLTQYGSEQTELIKEIRDFLVSNLDKRFTIDELSKKYHINTSSLKSVFKAVYGIPIASYINEYRMQQAEILLRSSDSSIAEIAEKVGYETQGKFTRSFKEYVKIVPSEYRKLYK